MTVDRRADRALYLQLADVLREDIAAGRLAPGARLPSETDLIDTHDVSRGTAREAIGILRREGLVLVEHGRGAFVRTTDLSVVSRATGVDATPLPFRDDFVRFVSAAGQQPSIRDLDPNPAAAAATPVELHAAEGAEVEQTRLLCFIDGRPVETAVVWEARPATQCAGTRVIEELTARMPTRAERRLLQLDDGTPVMVLRRILHGTDEVCEIAEAVLVAERLTLAYVLTRTGPH